MRPEDPVRLLAAFRRSSVVERAAVNRLVVSSNLTAGATFTLNRASLSPLVTIRIHGRVTLSVTLSRDGPLQHVDRLALLGCTDVL